MSLNQLFNTIEKTREAAHWQAAFGEPQEIDGRTIIPVAQVGYAYGLGFGSGAGPSAGEGEPVPEGEGAGGGGGASSKPLGAIVVTPEEVYFQETADANKVAIAAMIAGCLIVYQLAKTLRAILGRG